MYRASESGMWQVDVCDRNSMGSTCVCCCDREAERIRAGGVAVLDRAASSRVQGSAVLETAIARNTGA